MLFLMGTDFLIPLDPHATVYITREKESLELGRIGMTLQTSAGSLRPCAIGPNTLYIESLARIGRTDTFAYQKPVE